MFRRQRFLTGAEAAELGWFTPAGTAMTAADWSDPSALALALYLDGSGDPDRAADGSPLIDDDVAGLRTHDRLDGLVCARIVLSA